MAKKHKCPECPAGEKWAVPYADFLSLLLALFIALWAISEANPSKVEALKTEFIKIFDFTATQIIQEETRDNLKYKGSQEEKQDELDELKRIIANQQETIKKLQIALDQLEKQEILHLPSRVEFQRGSAQIQSADMRDYLRRIAQLISLLPSQVEIEIRGYTDNSDSILRSYELGYARAQSVLQYFIESGVNTKNINLKSYGFNDPIGEGAQALENNRAEIYFKLDIGDSSTKRSVLDLIERVN